MRRLVPVVALVGLLVAGCGGSSSSSASNYCSVAKQIGADIKLSPATDFKAAFQQFDSVADKFLNATPPEIRADANTVIAGVRQLETALRSVNYDATKIDDPTKLQSLSDPKFAAAGQRISDYNSKHCGITTSTT